MWPVRLDLVRRRVLLVGDCCIGGRGVRRRAAGVRGSRNLVLVAVGEEDIVGVETEEHRDLVVVGESRSLPVVRGSRSLEFLRIEVGVVVGSRRIVAAHNLYTCQWENDCEQQFEVFFRNHLPLCPCGGGEAWLCGFFSSLNSPSILLFNPDMNDILASSECKNNQFQKSKIAVRIYKQCSNFGTKRNQQLLFIISPAVLTQYTSHIRPLIRGSSYTGWCQDD